MYRAVLTLLVGLMLSLGGGMALSAPKVLPDGNPEEQYSFALSKAMQNDLDTAEKAFAEFRALNPGNELAASALYWLGRIHYLQDEFELAAMTFAEFNSVYPEDPRIPDSVLFIAEAISTFAPTHQACEIYASLSGLFDAPPQEVVQRLVKLSRDADCSQAQMGPLNELKKTIEKPKPAADGVLQNLAQALAAAEEAEKTRRLKVREDKASATIDTLAKITGNAVKANTRADASKISFNDIARIQKHIASCWQPPITAIGNNVLEVEILVRINEDGEVTKAAIEDKLRFNLDSYYRASAIAAQRAVVDCSPLPVPPEKYEILKEFTFNFNPGFFGRATGANKKTNFSNEVLQVKSNRFVDENGNVLWKNDPKELAKFSDEDICDKVIANDPDVADFWNEKTRRGLTCGVGEIASVQTAAAPNPYESSAELNAAQQEAQRLREELAALKAKQEEQQQIIATDNQVPLITITQTGTDQRKGIIRGFATDNVQLAEVLVDGTTVNVGADGSFEWTGFVPATGKDIFVEAIDTAALSSTQFVRLERGRIAQAIGPTFDDLNPMAGRRVLQNKNALALIVGISDYERTDAPAIYADKDAQYFHDYASLKLGILDQNIKTLVNDKAEQGDVLIAVKDWMRRSSKAGKSDIYIFFAGHGLASQDGEQMYLLPFDGRPRLLDETAILRQKLFSDIAAANPRSVTVFLDTCYSGTTRGPDMLIASRPIAIRAKEQAVPDGFTVMTAAAGDQTAKPLEEAKHGMFSYFLMKGMEGDADTNQDNQINAGELHAYVQQNVIQQSSGSQTPELQGDADRVLVRFQ